MLQCYASDTSWFKISIKDFQGSEKDFKEESLALLREHRAPCAILLATFKQIDHKIVNILNIKNNR
jgi:hypothetical protein